MFQNLKNIYHLLTSLIANLLLRFPSRGIRVIGVTGTDGKTTTSSIIYHILNETGMNPSMISSVGAFIGGKKYDVGSHVTTPTPSNLPRFIKKVKNEKSEFLILEVTSHALDQNRAWGVNFEIGVLTNVTNEHLDYHKTYENYAKAKFKLLKNAKTAILNKDDLSFKYAKALKNKIITYGIKNKADIMPENLSFEIKIQGDFNKYNTLAAISACRELGLADMQIKKGLNSFKLPIGRMEEIYKGNFSIMIDFAHTANSFKQLLSSVRNDTKGRIIHVFGAAGKRDFAKRPEMGKNSSEYSDIIILTAEDPRGENVEKINSEIEMGIDKKFKYQDYRNYEDNMKNKNIFFKIEDRREAIRFAISIAKKGDLVITTGKSHEKSMNYGKGEVLWDEFAIIREALREKI
ncbi:MAG: UDP-N-acetylmuramoyl-L-alanyl-D-glutamate--2,6-diaminopimelate ligase [Candidatus Levyibacteriota bacterium]